MSTSVSVYSFSNNLVYSQVFPQTCWNALTGRSADEHP